MVDTHCHLNFAAFNKDYDEVIKRAFRAGVTRIINVGTKIDTSKKAVELANKYENLYAVVGIHPHHADKLEKDWEVKLEKLAKNTKVVGIGECGMDFYRYNSNGVISEELQKEIFIKQIELASKLKKPLQVHNRQAGKEILKILQAHKSSLLNPPGMFHCFSGNLPFLKKVLNLGFYIGFDGNVTYQGLAPGESTSLQDLAKYTPLDRLVLETDSPYLAPIPFRGSRNEPKNVIIIAKFIAELKGLSETQIKQITEKNTDELFFSKDI